MYQRFHYGIALVAKSWEIDITVLTRRWREIYSHRCQNEGKKSATKFCKELNTVSERYALRQSITPIPWTKSDKDGFPNCLGRPFKEYLRSSDTRKVVLALSVMRTCEVLKLPISKDISTVTAESTADTKLIDDIIDFIPQWVNRLQRIHIGDLKYHCTLKNGPNGHALHESDSDLSAIMKVPELWGAISTIQDKLKNKSLAKIKIDENLSGLHSKLIQISDKAGKTRTVAIVDYYSQRALKPLHNSLMDLLRSLVSDGTYSHQNVGLFAQQKTKEKSFIYCADLTAFTDRFPALIQRELLFELIKDNEMSQSLWTLLAERQFTVAWSGEVVSYSCGQPMGCYASWALCSLAHHLLIEYCGHLVGVNRPYDYYRQIGDDTIITEPAIAQKYKELITALGVDISLSKTVESLANSDYSAAEVAKQLYLNGTCITPLTPGFVQNLRKPYMFNTCMEVLESRYDFIRSETYPMLINLFFKSKEKRDKVWLLLTNPINGVIAPENPAYNEHSPWIVKDITKLRDEFPKILIKYFSKEVRRQLGKNSDLLFFGKTPWKRSSPQPHCLKYVRSDIDRTLTELTISLTSISTGTEPSKLIEVISYIPNLDTPYMERQELRQKRLSSYIESLYDYGDDIQFEQVDGKYISLLPKVR